MQKAANLYKEEKINELDQIYDTQIKNDPDNSTANEWLYE